MVADFQDIDEKGRLTTTPTQEVCQAEKQMERTATDGQAPIDRATAPVQALQTSGAEALQSQAETLTDQRVVMQ